uniref:Chromatin assembly factor 1 subunit A n=1 Tax=Timema bartmani TaxID=61472 RepID=A0A7R9ETN7_9NEOP|nr:unnamed protein product [Timema bartmani]
MMLHCVTNNSIIHSVRFSLVLEATRLPFQVLSSGRSESTCLQAKKKRKLSDSATDDIKVIKVVRTDDTKACETKENLLGSAKNTVDKVLPEKRVSSVSIKTFLKASTDGKVEHLKRSRNVESKNSEKIKNNKTIEEVICISDSENESMQTNEVKIGLDTQVTPLKNKKVSPTKSETENGCEENKCKKENNEESKPGDTSKDDSSISEANLNSESDEARDDGTKANKRSSLSNNRIKAAKSSNTPSNKTDSPETNSVTPKSLMKTPRRKTPNSASMSMKLTPKQLQKQMDSAKKKEEREKQRLRKADTTGEISMELDNAVRDVRDERERDMVGEKEKKRTEEKEERAKQKQEKEEQRRKEREEKDEQKKKEKEEKEKKRQAEIDLKNEEKKAKEDERKAKEEERRRKEDVRLQEKKLKEQAEEEAKRKKEKEVAAFTSFFVSRKSDTRHPEEPVEAERQNFMPFMVKAGMRLATVSRTNLSSDRKKLLDEALTEQHSSTLYLDQLKNKEITPRTDVKTWPLSDIQDEVMIIDDEMAEMDKENLVVESHPMVSIPRPKCLLFAENRRPPYWGTWTKKSSLIGPRRPFGKEEKLFDYEVDSDDEWEEEEPGESLHGSDDEKESEDEYEVDNEFFVPHGYLSDEENSGEEETVTPEGMKAKLKLLELEFEQEMKHKTERIKPRLIGCIWTIGQENTAGVQFMKLLNSWRAVYRDTPISTSVPERETSSPTSPGQDNRLAKTPNTGSKSRKFPDTAVPELIKLVHGSLNSRAFLLREFLAHWNKQHSLNNSQSTTPETDPRQADEATHTVALSQKSISNKIKEIARWQACPEEGPMFGRKCWYVLKEIRSENNLSDLALLNKEWKYTFKPRRLELDPQSAAVLSPVTDPIPKIPGKSGQLITKFTQVLSTEEHKKRLKLASDEWVAKQSKQHVTVSSAKKTKKKLVYLTSTSPTKPVLPKKKVPFTTLPKVRKSLKQFMKPQSSDTGVETPSLRCENENVELALTNPPLKGGSTDPLTLPSPESAPGCMYLKIKSVVVICHTKPWVRNNMAARNQDGVTAMSDNSDAPEELTQCLESWTDDLSIDPGSVSLTLQLGHEFLIRNGKQGVLMYYSAPAVVTLHLGQLLHDYVS